MYSDIAESEARNFDSTASVPFSGRYGCINVLLLYFLWMY